MSHQKRIQELVECRNCGTKFDINRQHYYDNRCPACMNDEDDETRFQTFMRCIACSTKLPPEQSQTATSHGRTGTERVLVCSKGCKKHVETPMHAPRGPDISKGEQPYYDVDVADLNDMFNDDYEFPEEYQ